MLQQVPRSLHQWVPFMKVPCRFLVAKNAPFPGSRLGETPNGGGLVREFTLPKMAETFKLRMYNELPRFCHWNPGGVDPKALKFHIEIQIWAL